MVKLKNKSSQDTEKLLENNFLRELLTQEHQAKNANVKAYTFMKHSPLIKVSNQRLEAIHDCGNFVKWALEPEKKKKKLLYIETCDSRFCARCQRVEAMKNGIKLYTLANYLRLERDKRFLFVTLTVPNVKGDHLKAEISRINKAFDSMIRRAQFKQFTGFVAKLEITYNRKADTYHPHLHVILSADKGYFKKSNKNYLTRDDLLAHWVSATGDDSITQVDIRAIRDKNGTKQLEKSILELCKYEAKSGDFTLNQGVFETFYFAISGAKMLRYGREFRELGKVYDVDEFGLFEDYKPQSENFDKFTCKSVSTWHFKDKEYKTAIQELTMEERLLLKKKTTFKSYNQFLTMVKRAKKDELALSNDLARFTTRLENQIARFKPALTIETTQARIRKTKAKLGRVRAKLSVYDTIDKEFRPYFKRKK